MLLMAHQFKLPIPQKFLTFFFLTRLEKEEAEVKKRLLFKGFGEDSKVARTWMGEREEFHLSQSVCLAHRHVSPNLYEGDSFAYFILWCQGSNPGLQAY
jgi:hypothetical protein